MCRRTRTNPYIFDNETFENEGVSYSGLALAQQDGPRALDPPQAEGSSGSGTEECGNPLFAPGHAFVAEQAAY